MKNSLENSKMIIITAMRYLFYKNNMNFNDILEENSYFQEFIKKIDYCDNLETVKNIINEYQEEDLKEILKSKEFYQYLKTMNFTDEDLKVLEKLI